MGINLKDSWRFLFMLALLALGGGVIHLWERAGEASVSRHPLREMPSQIGSWRQAGADQRFDEQTESVLRADDYISRTYVRTDGHVASFYVGYYATQRNGATYHSPLNCLPGSGWEMSDPAPITITPADGSPAFEANRYIVENGDDKQLLIYWYQGRGRKLASEYWGKIYTVIDSIRLRRSDGAMIRVMMPLGMSEEETLHAAQDLAAQVAPVLPAFVPN
ncbi:MAG TPA: EpsI family protein [Pyrinomonadaceae bacterium]|nr:EpsI family protein [Pyrinomonadaceae bacterium]